MSNAQQDALQEVIKQRLVERSLELERQGLARILDIDPASITAIIGVHGGHTKTVRYRLADGSEHDHQLTDREIDDLTEWFGAQERYTFGPTQPW
jgi:uncharacterized protein with von Willebrand factor type A (vWA) domain